MKIKSHQLLNELIEEIKKGNQKAKHFYEQGKNVCNHVPKGEKWSISDCLEHLNLYGDFYIPEIQNAIINSNPDSRNNEFKSGWFGNYSANSMLPKNGKIRKMKTFKDKDPELLELDFETVFARFFKQQESWIDLLEKAKSVNLNKIRSKTTLKFISFKLGDTFRFVINHSSRHFDQAERIFKASLIETKEKEKAIETLQ